MSDPLATPTRANASLISAITPNLRRLLAVSAASTFGFYGISSFLSPYLRSSGVAVVWVGLFYSLSSAFETPVTFLGGVLADRIGRRPIVAIGRLLRSIGWATVVLFPKPVGLAVGAALLGAGGLAGSAYRALIAESAAPGRRASAFAIAIVVESLMGMVMPPVVGLAAARLGLQPVLVLAAVLSGAAVAALMRRVKETMVPHGGAAAGPPGLAASELSAAALDRPPSPWDSLRFMAGPEGRGATLMAVVWLFTGFGMGLIPPIWGLYVIDRFGVGYAALGAISTSMSLGMVIGSLLGGHVADRVGHSRLMILSLYVTVPSWLLITVAGDPWAFSVLSVLTYVVAYVSATCWEAVGANATPTRVRGGVSGVYGALQAVGTMFAAVAAGLVYSRNIVLPWYLLAAADLVMLFLITIGRRAGWRGFAVKPAGAEAD